MLLQAIVPRRVRVLKDRQRKPQTLDLRVKVPVEIAEVSKSALMPAVRVTEDDTPETMFYGYGGMLFSAAHHVSAGRVIDVGMLRGYIQSPPEPHFWPSPFLNSQLISLSMIAPPANERDFMEWFNKRPMLEDVPGIGKVVDDGMAAAVRLASTAATQLIVVGDEVYDSRPQPVWFVDKNRGLVTVSAWAEPYHIERMHRFADVPRFNALRLEDARDFSSLFWKVPLGQIATVGAMEIIDPGLIPQMDVERFTKHLRFNDEIMKLLSHLPEPVVRAWTEHLTAQRRLLDGDTRPGTLLTVMTGFFDVLHGVQDLHIDERTEAFTVLDQTLRDMRAADGRMAVVRGREIEMPKLRDLVLRTEETDLSTLEP